MRQKYIKSAAKPKIDMKRAQSAVASRIQKFKFRRLTLKKIKSQRLNYFA